MQRSDGHAPVDTMSELTAQMAEGRMRLGRIKMLLILAVCASPVIFGTLAYWFYRSDATTNYGSFIEPQRQAIGLENFRGKWVIFTVDSPNCDEVCAKRLYVMRQVRLTLGKDKDRVERVLLLTTPDKAQFVVAGVESLEKVHQGLHQIYLDSDQRRQLMGEPLPTSNQGVLPSKSTTAEQSVDSSEKGIYLVDPLGHVMMRFPEDPDPGRMKKDLAKLLKWSRVG